MNTDYDKTSSVAKKFEIARTTLQGAVNAGHVRSFILPISGEILVSISDTKKWNNKRTKKKAKKKR